MHRDVKPQNVIVPDAPRSAAGVAKLADFGVAHLAGDDPLTRTGDVVGTLAYMAPEQAAGKRIDERADLYSLALVLYEALAGVNPVRAGSPAATARRVGTVLPPLRRSRKDLPEELCAAIDRALRPKPDERGTLGELADELAESLPEVSDEGGDGSSPAPARAHRSRAPARHRPGGSRPRSPAALVAARAGVAGEPVAGPRSPPSPPSRCCRGVGWLRRRGRDDRRDRRRTARAPRSWSPPRSRPSRCCCAAAAPPGRCPALAPLLGAGDASRAPTRRSPGRARGALDAGRALGRAAAPGGRCSPRSLARARAARSIRRGCRAAGADADVGERAASTTCSARCSPAARCSTRPSGPLAALSLPWLVRGRWLALDVVAACAWAAALGAVNRRDSRVRSALQSRADSSSGACRGRFSRSRYHTSGEYGWWSRDAWPDTVHRQSWPSPSG